MSRFRVICTSFAVIAALGFTGVGVVAAARPAPTVVNACFACPFNNGVQADDPTMVAV